MPEQFSVSSERSEKIVTTFGCIMDWVIGVTSHQVVGSQKQLVRFKMYCSFTLRES